MKKLIFGIFCLFLSYNAFSQTDGNYNYSIGVRGYSLMQFPKILNQTNFQDLTNTYFNGLIIKFNDNQISYRISANYFKKDTQFFNECESCEIAEGKVNDYSFKVGFEKNINYAIFQPYFGADLGFRANSFSGDVRNNNPKSTRNSYNADADKNGFVIAPILGFKVNPVKNISFFAETSLDFFYSYEKQETIEKDAANTRTFVKYNKWEFLLNPVSVGLQVQLGSKN